MYTGFGNWIMAGFNKKCSAWQIKTTAPPNTCSMGSGLLGLVFKVLS
jgi:hypothetical protein